MCSALETIALVYEWEIKMTRIGIDIVFYLESKSKDICFGFGFLLQRLHWLYLMNWATFLLQKKYLILLGRINNLTLQHSQCLISCQLPFGVCQDNYYWLPQSSQPAHPQCHSTSQGPLWDRFEFFCLFLEASSEDVLHTDVFLLCLSADNRPPLIWTSATTFSHFGPISLCRSL